MSLHRADEGSIPSSSTHSLTHSHVLLTARLAIVALARLLPACGRTRAGFDLRERSAHGLGSAAGLLVLLAAGNAGALPLLWWGRASIVRAWAAAPAN